MLLPANMLAFAAQHIAAQHTKSTQIKRYICVTHVRQYVFGSHHLQNGTYAFAFYANPFRVDTHLRLLLRVHCVCIFSHIGIPRVSLKPVMNVWNMHWIFHVLFIQIDILFTSLYTHLLQYIRKTNKIMISGA